jgi:hypothetical protein
MHKQQEDECYSSLLGSGQSSSELALWQSHDVFSVGPASTPIEWHDKEHMM